LGGDSLPANSPPRSGLRFFDALAHAHHSLVSNVVAIAIDANSSGERSCAPLSGSLSIAFCTLHRPLLRTFDAFADIGASVIAPIVESIAPDDVLG